VVSTDLVVPFLVLAVVGLVPVWVLLRRVATAGGRLGTASSPSTTTTRRSLHRAS
jgi:hypothetical protein